ncbi:MULTISPECIES: dTMP kinase [unclassified Mycoplasma]|uniref:dTMP kinase n=1 Tax=unclassified Mycoplasma TaxID=2683645 RepID=UPI00211C58B5|nr:MULTISPECIES: dTMP kinase [unclassified Mycoplasma]UUM19716.1 dTMP kinase [Mycoplasma sp. 1578d]UUM24699.1 dTMP kinase [Mycoplasma sp. 3686d]
MFITFEGLDGSGKTTIINKLMQYLQSKFNLSNIVLTREPGGQGLREAEKIREIILDSSSDLSAVAEAMLYSTSRRIHLEKIIWPALQSEKLVLCDRYIDSFYVYQGFARNLGFEYVKKLTELVIDNALPDITIFFNLTPQQAKIRRNSTRLVEDRMEKEKESFHQSVYDGYWTLIKQDPKRFLIIDASQSEEQVFNEVVEKLMQHAQFKEYLNKHAH